MNNREMNTSSDFPHEQSPNVNERHPGEIGMLAFDDSRGVHATQFRLPTWVAIVIIVIFWVAQFSIATAQLFFSGSFQANQLLIPRAISAVLGALISFGMLKVLESLRDYSLIARAIGALILAITGAAVLALVNYPLFAPFGGPGPLTPLPISWSVYFLTRLWAFVAISATFLSLSYTLDIRERENRIHALQALAHSAQIRALRNQLNPHFLFNALNSIAGLISAKRVSEAETMTESLADFLRLTLALDPQTLITLDEELRLQGLYLSIEQVRFPGRLNAKVDVPADLSIALVPSLITQPLIENSIKYAVAQSTQSVDLRIGATRTGDHLEITISDSGGNADVPPSKGAGLGLRNVAERVSMHYGEEGHFVTEANPAGGFRNVIKIPLRFQR